VRERDGGQIWREQSNDNGSDLAWECEICETDRGATFSGGAINCAINAGPASTGIAWFGVSAWRFECRSDAWQQVRPI